MIQSTSQYFLLSEDRLNPVLPRQTSSDHSMDDQENDPDNDSSMWNMLSEEFHKHLEMDDKKIFEFGFYGIDFSVHQ